MSTVANLIKALQAAPHTSAVVAFEPASVLSGVLTAATGSMAMTAHGLAVNDPVFLVSVATTTGAVATAAESVVYVKTVTDANNFITSATPGGAALTGTTNGTYVAVPAGFSTATADASVQTTAQSDGDNAPTVDPGAVILA